MWAKTVLLLSLVGLPLAGRCESAANSDPTPGEVLVFLSTVRDETTLRFKGYSKAAGGRLTFSINVGSLDYTFFAGLGEQVASDKRKTNYRISKFEEAFEEYFDPSINVKRMREVSRLTLVRMDDDAEIVLRYGVPHWDMRLRAKLRNRLDDYVFTVSKGDGFQLQNLLYKVVEIKEDRVVIMDSRKRECIISAPKKIGE